MSAVLQIETLFENGFQAHCQGDLSRAISLYQQVLRICPDHAPTLKAFGVLAFSHGAIDKGLEMLTAATVCHPKDAEAWSNLGNALRCIERHSESVEACQKAVALNPQDGNAHSNLSAALRCLGRLSESLHHAGLAVELIPQLPEAHINLASGFQNLGETDTALIALSQAAQLNPTHVSTRQNLLFTSLYSDQLTDEDVTQMHADFGAMFATPQRPAKRDRCRNIGFVSGDFRKHPVGRFFASLLPFVDRS
ncbi:MAG: tetratricopeptide repeat protein, partial [bacterium]